MSADGDAIVVTARRRAEDAQAVPAAMTVVNADTLARTYTVNTSQLSQLVPALNYCSPNPRNKVKGVEADASARIAAHFTLRLSGAYSDGRYASYATGPCPIELTGSSTARRDPTDKWLPGLLRWSGSIGGEYTIPLSTGEVFVRADANASTRVFGDATGSAYTVIGGYILVNASIGFRAAKGWEVAVFARNLIGRNYLQALTAQAGNSGLIVGTPSEPRMFSATPRSRQ